MANAGTTSGGTETRPRARMSSHSSDDKKPRGRPRVEPQDETAADRRRTQIRLAQRAYRLRKETTIASLKQRTASLTEIINDMQTALALFSEKANTAGLANTNATLAAELINTEQVFVLLKERALATCDEDALDGPEKSLKTESDVSVGSPSSDGQSPSKKLKRSAPEEPAEKLPAISDTVERGVPSVWGYEMIYDGTDPAPQQTADSETTSTSGEMPPMADFWNELSDTMQMEIDLQTPRPSKATPHVQNALSVTNVGALSGPNASIRAPASFAWGETSFARQLHRSTLEAGVLLIQRRFLTPERFKKKFQMCLPFGDSDHILNKIKNTLCRDSSEPLDWNDHPMRHLGGAGTHYCRRSESGDNSPANAPVLVTGALGPSELAELMNSANESTRNGKMLNIAGFEGEWFDAKDVEGYLERKGIRFEPGSSFALLETSENVEGKTSPSSMSLDSLDYFSMGQTGPEQRSRKSSMDRQHPSQQKLPWEDSASDSLGPLTSIHLGADQNLGRAGSRETGKVLIDVQKLVRELVKYATCIGRSPGYRRRDVDKAFRAALSMSL